MLVLLIFKNSVSHILACLSISLLNYDEIISETNLWVVSYFPSQTLLSVGDVKFHNYGKLSVKY